MLLKQDKKFLRQCCSCRQLKQKEDLIRLTKDFKTNEVIINNNLISGRSAYLCKNQECILNAIKKKKLEHALKTDISEILKEKLKNITE